jgi:hypothetical protein
MDVKIIKELNALTKTMQPQTATHKAIINRQTLTIS